HFRARQNDSPPNALWAPDENLESEMTDYANLPLRDTEGELQAVIETPKGCGIKYCYDVGLHVFGISKFLNAGLVFPCDFGFFPSTRAEDGDPLDIMVVHDAGTFPG